MRRGVVLLLLVPLLAGHLGERPLPGVGARAPGALPLTHVTDLRLPGRSTRFDYQAIDSTGRRLYIAHLGDSSLLVVDVDAPRVVATTADVARVHGVAIAADRHVVYATATGVDQLVGIDTATNRIVSRTATGRFPDGIAYDTRDGRAFVSDKNDGAITVVDVGTSVAVSTIKLGDETGNVAYDPATATVYAAARTPDELVAIDAATAEPIRRVRLPGCDGAHGVYLDGTAQRVYVACERNARLVAVDLRSGHELAHAMVGAGPDVLAFDVALHRLYVAAESGTVSVFDTSGTFRRIGQAHFAAGAHSVAVDQHTHRVFFPLPDVGGHPVLRVMQPR